MRRTVLTALLPALALLLAACATRPADTAARLQSPFEAGTVGAATLAPVAAVPAQDDDSNEPGAADYIAVVPENLLWVPWKIVGGTVKGLFDGVAEGFAPERLPILGVLFAPLNAALGTLTGFVTGTVSAPALIGPRDNFSKTIGLPMQRPTPIWWLPD